MYLLKDLNKITRQYENSMYWRIYEEYNLNTSLKKKQKGRNRDGHVSNMDNYIEMKKQLEKNIETLEKANKNFWN